MDILNMLYIYFIATWTTTLYAFLCTIILCLLFQIFVLRKAARLDGIRLSASHFIWVYILLLYLTLVYMVTGTGSIWDLIYYNGTFYLDEIYLIPFETFEASAALSNILSYLMNIVMTIPLGFLLPLIWTEFRSVKKVAITGFTFSLVIELSQLLNRRATTIDDVIMNTLGAVLGCLLFKLLFKLFGSSNDFRPKTKASSPIIKNEAIVYLVCSFLGIFLLFNSLLDLGYYGGDYSDEIIAGEIVETEYIKAGVLEVQDDSIIIDVITTWVSEDGIISSNTGNEIKINTTDETIFEISRTDSAGTKEPTIEEATLESINSNGIKDMVEVYLIEGNQDAVAEKIIILRFDG